MKHQGIGRQLTLLVVAFAVIALSAVAALSYLLHRSTGESARLAAATYAKNEALFALVDAIGKQQNVAQRLIREKDPDQIEKLLEESKSLSQAVEASLRGAGAESGAVGQAWRTLAGANGRCTEVMLRGEYALAQQMFIEEANPAFGNVVAAIGQLQDEVERTTSSELAAVSKANARVERLVSLLVLASVGALAALALVLVRRITRNVRRAAVDLAKSADELAGAAGQVSGSSQALAQGASEQAATLEETSASAEEINSMTRRNAENSNTIAGLMTENITSVENANRRLDHMMQSMRGLSASSEKISKIIKVIDEIAFQTNILALNAAVEAARAGEAGMGFAVVADEVRQLAQRCAQAARDTTSLIEESIAASADGGRRLDEVADAVRSMTASADRIKSLLDQVNESSQQQASGMAEIARGVSQMEQVTQQTAASAEEGAAAGSQLSAQIENLRGVANRLVTLVGSA